MKARLTALQDPAYKAFQSRLIPNIDPDTVIGVRAPALRKLSKSLTLDLLGSLPHTYYEENLLHAYLISRLNDPAQCVSALDVFLPYVDNWAVCDSLRPVCVTANKAFFLPHIDRWLQSCHPYTVRFAIEMLMLHYLEDSFDPQYMELVSKVSSNNYYVNMMVAWYFATALALQYDIAVVYLQNNLLPQWIHNKAIQKATESFRITQDTKAYLRTLKRR